MLRGILCVVVFPFGEQSTSHHNILLCTLNTDKHFSFGCI